MRNEDKIIIDLCGGTGTWSKPYSDNGYEVINATLPDMDMTTEKVIKELIAYKPYGILFAPECTVWANSGVRWWTNRTSQEIYEATMILVSGFRIIYQSKPVFWALENPIGKMRNLLGDPSLIFDPCDYGNPYTKRTLLWGEFNIPEQSPVSATEGSKMHLNYGGKSEYVKRMRSITPPGFAKAFFKANK